MPTGDDGFTRESPETEPAEAAKGQGNRPPVRPPRPPRPPRPLPAELDAAEAPLAPEIEERVLAFLKKSKSARTWVEPE